MSLNNVFFIDIDPILNLLLSYNLIEHYSIKKIYPNSINIFILPTKFIAKIKNKNGVFMIGNHNLSNLSGAKLICQLMGVQEEEFNSSIVSFGGADKRLESLLEMNDRAFFKSSTILGLAFALLIARTSFKFKKTIRVLSVLPIITPPFVIGLAIIILFGRSGAVSTFLEWGFDIEPSRWIYGLPSLNKKNFDLINMET